MAHQQRVNMAKIQDLISQITKAGGLARPNRFAVQIVPPNISSIINQNNNLTLQQIHAAQQQSQLNGSNTQSQGLPSNYFEVMDIAESDIPNRLDFMCNKADLPGKSFNTNSVKTYGAYFDIPFVDVYTNTTLSFMVGRDMVEKHFFDAWSYTIQDPETSDFNYVADYATTMDVYQLDEADKATYGVRFFQCWPKEIGELHLEYGIMNTFHVLPITFTFRKWVNLRINSGTPTTIESSGGTPAGFESTIRPQKEQ
jgi:hypothetical protein